MHPSFKHQTKSYNTRAFIEPFLPLRYRSPVRRAALLVALCLGACSSEVPSSTPDSFVRPVDASIPLGDLSFSDAGALACATPATYTTVTGTCGTERWFVKTGTDSTSSKVNLTPALATIAYLRSLPAPNPATLPPSTRVPPVEETTYELKDVTLVEIKLETDLDYHLVLSDGKSTMIAEVPYPGCARSGPMACAITHARARADTLSPTGFFTPVNQPVTVIGVGFWDFIHGQSGVAPNGIELHPVSALCFGLGCDPRAP